MSKKREKILSLLRKNIFFLLTLFILLPIFLCKKRNQKYLFFIEFNNANGIIVGTPIKMRGISIGFINNIQLKVNSVLVSVTISSHKILIPKNSLIETSQTGLLNESVVDIIPVESTNFNISENPLSVMCDSSSIICNNMYLSGERGLNYDDLVRATTRISQRFDDPTFFYLFCGFLEQTVGLIDSFSIFFQMMLNKS